MRGIPARIAMPPSAADVTAEIRRLLRAAGIRDQLPTPKEQILACRKLIETGELDLAEYEATLKEKALSYFHKAKSKVLGLLDRRSQIIHVAPHVHDSRKPFVLYHEVVHDVLEWQRILATQEDEATLSAECEDLFEAEANFGAADILFQCDRFEKEARDYKLSLESALYLSETYGASCHATLRRFVERNHRSCLLMVLKPTTRRYFDGQRSFYVVYPLRSSAFAEEFGEQLREPFINPENELGKILNEGTDGQIILQDRKGFSRFCTVQIFDNNFRTFALIYPEHTGRSRKIVRYDSQARIQD